MYILRHSIAMLALGVSLHAAAAPTEVTFSAEIENLKKDGQPVSSVNLGSHSTYANGSVLPGKFTYDLQGPGNQVWHNGDSPDPTYWWADSMHVQGTYAIELGNLGYWEHSPFYYDARIDIDSRADGVFVSLSNSGNYSFRLDFRGAAHSLDNATYFGDVLDQVFLGTGFTLTQATFRGEYFTETEFGSEQFFWGGDLSIDDFQNVSPVPEPSTAAMAAAGLFVLGAVARRRKAGDAKRIAA